MATKHWRKLNDNGASMTYASSTMTFVSAFEKSGKGWIARTPKSTHENLDKEKALKLIKSYMNKYAS